MTVLTLSGTLIEASLRGGLALMIVGAVALVLRRRSGALRHALWLAGLVCLLVAPAAFRWLPPLALPILPAQVASPISSLAGVTVESSSHGSERISIREQPRSRTRLSSEALWTAMWLAGLAWMAARLMRAQRGVRELVRESITVRDPRVLAAWRAVAGVGAGFECRASSKVEVALACGLSRGVVVLPFRAAAWSDGELHAVLTHEVAHLRRRDPLWLAIAQAIRALYWFHPLAWWATRELRAESERACDDAVIRAGERPSRYAETLLSFATGAAPEPAAALAFLRRNGLEARIAGILAEGRDRRTLGRGERWGVAAFALAAALSLALLRPIPSRASRADTPPPPAPQPVALASTAQPSVKAPRPEAANSRLAPEAWLSRAQSVEPVVARFRNKADCPVKIRYAVARFVEVAKGMTGVTMPELTLENRDVRRRVIAILLQSELPSTRDRSQIAVSIEPASTTRLTVPGSKWSAVVPSDDAQSFRLSVVGVRFEDLDAWDWPSATPPTPATPPALPEMAVPPVPTEPSTAPRSKSPTAIAPEAPIAPGPEAPVAPAPPVPTVPPTPPSERWQAWPDPRSTPQPGARPSTEARPDLEGWIPAVVRNPKDAPVVILEANTLPHPAVARGEDPLTWLPEIVVENRSARRVVGLRLRFKADPEGHAVSGVTVSIPPHEKRILHREGLEITGKPQNMTVQLLGARFADGMVWGTLDSRIDARDPWVYPLTRDGR